MKELFDEENRTEYLKTHRDEIMEHKTFCEIFLDTVKRYPGRTAVYADERTVTYEELLRWSNSVTHCLLQSNVEREEIIAVNTGRVAETIASIIGIWKAGCVYVYLDRTYPEERGENIILECHCRILIDSRWWEEIDREITLPEINYSERDCLALLIYTSGSTSRPKSVILEHKNVMASVHNLQLSEITEKERFGVFPGSGFVVAVSDLFSTLAVGAANYAIPGSIQKNIVGLARFYRRHRINITFLPPHMARKLLSVDLEDIPLCLLLVGSEPVRNLDISRAHFRIFNIYGASEMCSTIAHYEIRDGGGKAIYPVGRLNPGLKGYLIGEDENAVCPGEPGELWFSGSQVSREYYGLPETICTHYTENPFTREKGYEWVFKTNDILMELPDGSLQYACRMDSIFKIGGFRVGAGAVETAIMECGEVKEAAVKAFTDQGGCNILCGYFTADKRLDVRVIKERMREKIPYYMVPACLIQLDAFPLNISSEIDRKAIMPPKELNNHKLLEKLY